jgi:hypothetical protein
LVKSTMSIRKPQRAGGVAEVALLGGLFGGKTEAVDTQMNCRLPDERVGLFVRTAKIPPPDPHSLVRAPSWLL